jgi:hypothetical protein
MDHRHADYGFTVLGQKLVIFTQQAMPVASARGPLDHPTPGDDLKPLGGVWPLSYL